MDNTLTQIKKSVASFRSLTQKDVQSEIDSRRAEAFRSELMYIVEDDEGDITSIESYSMNDLVISEAEVFEKIKEEMAAEINNEINEFCWDTRMKQDIFEIQVGMDDKMNLFYHYEHFTNKDYGKAKKHYLKKKSSYRSSVRRMTREKYLKQSSLVAKVLNTASKFAVVQILRNYNFLDDSLESVVRRFYSLLIPMDYNRLSDGEDLKGRLKYIR